MHPLLTLSLWLFYVALAFGVRTWLSLRQTGQTGFAGLRRGASWVERLAALAMVSAFVVVPVVPFVLPSTQSVARQVAGLAVYGAGVALTWRAQWVMGASWRIGVDEDARTGLVTHDVFAWVRNPIFSGMVLTLAGLALGASWPAGVAVVLLWLSLEAQVRLAEEPYLARTHGAAYHAWAARTGRFVPWLGRLRDRV